MTRRERIETAIGGNLWWLSPIVLADFVMELRALWAVVDAADVLRDATHHESGQAVAFCKMGDALDAYHEGDE